MTENFLKQAERIQPKDDAFDKIKAEIQANNANIVNGKSKKNYIITRMVASFLFVGAAIMIMLINYPSENKGKLMASNQNKVENSNTNTITNQNQEVALEELDEDDLFLWYASLNENTDNDYELVW